MGNIQKLVLTLSDQDALQTIHCDKLTSTEFSLVAVMGEIEEIKLVSESVLVLNFETGELRLDIDLTNVKNMKNVE